MNIVKHLKQMLTILTLTIALSSCKDKSPMLVRTWKLQDLKYTHEVPKEMQGTIDQSVNQLKQSFLLTYNADGTYSTKMGDNTLQGKWQLNWNSSKITSTTRQGDVKEYTVVDLSNDKFSFEATEGKEKVIFVMVPAK